MNINDNQLLQIKYDGQIKNLCGNTFGDNEAKTACQSILYEKPADGVIATGSVSFTYQFTTLCD